MPDRVLRSPIAPFDILADPDHAPGPAETIALRELRPAGMALVAAWPETLTQVAQVLAGLDDVLQLGPGRFLVVGRDVDPVPGLSRAFDIATAAVTDVGHARAVVRVSGKPVADMLLKGLALDLDTAAFPPGATAQAAIHGIGVIVHRRDDTAFELFCFRGFTLSLWEWLIDAATEYGCAIEPSAF